MGKLPLLLLVATVACSATGAGEPDVKFHRKCLYPTIAVHPADKPASGTGVVLRSERNGGHYRNVFLTCRHVVQPGPFRVDVYDYEKWSRLTGYKSYPCEFFAVDEGSDLALGVFLSAEAVATADLDADTTLYINDDLFRIGCGLGDQPRLDAGKLTSVNFNIKNIRLKNALRTSVHSLPGDSGSPVFHKGRVIGVMVALRTCDLGGGKQPVFNYSLAVPATRLATWNEEQHDFLAFGWKDRVMPELPFHKLRLSRWRETE